MISCCDDSLKPRLFNWVTMLLVTGWVLVVTVVVGITEHQPAAADVPVHVFIERLLN